MVASKVDVVSSRRASPRFLQTPVFAGIVISLSVVAAYVGTLQVPFLFDDIAAIVDNPSIRKLGALGTVLSPPADAGTGGRPFANLTFALSHAISGLEPWGYHLLNVTIHTLAALVLCGVVRRTLLTPLLAPKFRDDALWLAGAIAVVWAVHPLQTQTVTYISQRTESLMALFYLLTLYCFIRGINGNAKLWHTLSVVAALLGAMSKEVIATVPLMVLFHDRTFVAGSFRAALRERRWLYVGLAGTWVVLAWFLADVRNRGVGYGIGVDWTLYALTQCRSVVQYLSLCVWPHPLIFDRGPLFIPSIADAVPYALVLAALLAGSVWALARRPALGFVCAWFFVILAPTSSVVPVTQAPMAENRPYLPLAAVVTLVIVGLRHQAGGRVTGAVCLTLAALSVVATVRRNRDYQSGISIWEDNCRKLEGNPRAHNNLALLLSHRPDRQVDAIAHYETALRLRPDYADAHNNLALLLAGMPGRQMEALTHYEAAVRLKPEYAEAHDNLANLLSRLPGRQDDALAHYAIALKLKPDFGGAHNNLAVLLANLPGRQADALAHFEIALRLRPNHAETHFNLANLLASQAGRQAEARAHYETALRLKPGFAEAHNNLANLLVTIPGREAEAVTHYESALRFKPEHAHAHGNLALLLARLPGRQSDAIAHFEAALRIRPDHPEAHSNLAALLAGLPGRQIEAAVHYETALRLRPDQAEVHNNLANILASQPGRRADALAHYEAALRLLPTSADLHFNYATELAKSPATQKEAALHFEAALKIDPNFSAAKEALQHLRGNTR